MPRILSAAQAAALVRDGDVLAVGGNGGTGVAESVLVALEERFLATAAPQGLTVFHVTGIGAVTEKGLCRLAHEGLVRRVIGGNYGLQLPFMKLIVDDRIQAYNFPQGVMAQLCRTLAARQPGVLTHVGLHTYMDPRQDGGRMNRSTTEELVSVIPVQGEDFLLYRAPTPTIAFLRGTSADEDGYVSMEHEATTREELSLAQAVHNAGGTVIVQVKRIVRRGTLHPQLVKIPGFLVDCLVVDAQQMQTYATAHDARALRRNHRAGLEHRTGPDVRTASDRAPGRLRASARRCRQPRRGRIRDDPQRGRRRRRERRHHAHR